LGYSKLIVCCGPGGVGKTTTAAALALRAAQLGQTALVLTIDPARRLATCLGLDELAHEPSLVTRTPEHGQLWAMMLDTRRTFDELITQLSPDPETAERVLKSRLYSVFAGTMHGTQEYMALESLYRVYGSGQFDLVVLDTPPLTNALDFFRVPKRASWLFDERVMRWFIPEQKPRGLRRLAPGAVVMRLLSHLAGPSLVADLTEFFTALQILRESLKARGDEVGRILRATSSAYLVVTSADHRRIDEALFLESQLREIRQRADLFIVNRTHHLYHSAAPTTANRPEEPARGALEARLSALAGRSVSEAESRRVTELVDGLAGSARRHVREVVRLGNRVGHERVCVVPDFERDVYRLEQLAELAEHLVSGELASVPASG
jgi:anion-transporting  ArsA/GET3 family ATPase